MTAVGADASRSYRIRTVRLINFHNFVDETIEVRGGGHLFLLGDNGSGKTTVLDAVHYVLAGGDLELNAAARIGGRRDDGRTLQGVVLRYDPERGVRNESGAIAYAALELVDGAGRVLSLGVGAEATTMEARVSKWGFVSPRPLADIRLLDGEEAPVDREALRRQLGAAQVHAPLAGYRKDVANRLFDSERHLAEAIRFWGMAKAYREIVTSARDFGALFERLLPEPDTAVFGEILRTLRAIDELEVALADLDAQAEYVRAVAGLVHEVAAGRETVARYGWLACIREREEVDAEAVRASAEAAARRDDAARLSREAEAVRLRCDRTEETLRRVAADDAAGVLAAVRDGEARRREALHDADRAVEEGEAARREHQAATRSSLLRRDELAVLAADRATALRAATARGASVPGELAALVRLADALEAIDVDGAGLPDSGDAAAELDELLGRTDERRLAADVALGAAEAALIASSECVAMLQRVDEAAPRGQGFGAVCAALTAAGVPYDALYRALEPCPDADPLALAAVEALVGDEVMGAILVAPGDRDRARAIAAEAGPAVRVLVDDVDEGVLPSWCAALFDASIATGRAGRALAAALAQPAALGAVAAPGSDGAVELRGLAFRVDAAAPRLLGRQARRRGHEAEVERARQVFAAASRDHEAARRNRDAARAETTRTRDVASALAAATGPAMHAAWHSTSAARQRAALTAAGLAGAEARVATATGRVNAIDADLAALRARVDGVDLDELDRRISALRVACEEGRTRWQDLLSQEARARGVAAAAQARSDAAIARVTDLRRESEDATRRLRACLAVLGSAVASADDDALAHYVRVTQRGDAFHSLETLRQRIAEVERACAAAADELTRDGSRGVRCLAHAARFGFAYDPVANQVHDRRDQPLAGVLTELERAIAEQRTVVNERTHTLMDTLVMGELARHLQGQVHQLYDTIKGINRVLRGLRFGPTEYQFQVTARPDRAELIELVRRLSILDESSRAQFRAWIEAHLEELKGEDGSDMPALLDYRRWFEFKLRMSTTDAEGIELTQRLRQVGSGGEQGVPNYLLVLALSTLMFDAGGARIRPLLFDEAFYGIDGGRRDQLLRLATSLGLQLFVASPDQDGATPAAGAATTLFVVKDAEHDIHLAPYHYWSRGPQQALFEAEPAATDAACRVGAPSS